ncbi:MAG: hypothetical protein ACYS1C_04725 [Planctomycetota bacterium]|jgi:predicted RNA-binding Zn-ribbon protein involved in translation (DUF1610 family)
MAIQIPCSNTECGRLFTLEDEDQFKRIKCSKCGAVTKVADALAAQQVAAIRRAAGDSNHHPARLTCTNCGAVLGVRDAVCPNCGGDVRSGVTVMGMTEEERQQLLLLRRQRMRRIAMAAVAALLLISLAVAGVLFGPELLERYDIPLPGKSSEVKPAPGRPAGSGSRSRRPSQARRPGQPAGP